jgi:hypothetical protein
VRLHRRFEIGVLGLEIAEHLFVLDLRVEGVLQPGIGVLDHIAVAFVAVGARFGAGRERKLVGHGAFFRTSGE